MIWTVTGCHAVAGTIEAVNHTFQPLGAGDVVVCNVATGVVSRPADRRKIPRGCSLAAVLEPIPLDAAGRVNVRGRVMVRVVPSA